MSDAPSTAKKRARLDDADTRDKSYIHMDHLIPHYETVLVIWSQPMTGEQQRYLIKYMRELVKLKSAADLMKPCSGKHLAKAIKKPLSLSAIKLRLDVGRFSTIAELFTNFETMIKNVLSTNGEDHKASVAATKLFKCFCRRMRYCPFGPHRKPMHEYAEHDIKLLASQITDAASKATKRSSEKLESIDIDDSNTNEFDLMASESDSDVSEDESEQASHKTTTTRAELEGPSVVALCSSISWPLNEPPHIPIFETTKTYDPNSLDEEARQLQQEIEERQQKLANMVQKLSLIHI